MCYIITVCPKWAFAYKVEIYPINQFGRHVPIHTNILSVYVQEKEVHLRFLWFNNFEEWLRGFLKGVTKNNRQKTTKKNKEKQIIKRERYVQKRIRAFMEFGTVQGPSYKTRRVVEIEEELDNNNGKNT